MPRKKVKASRTLRVLVAQAPEISDVSRQLASLALVGVEQEKPLNVRQREHLRRALATAGDALGWAGWVAENGNSVDKVNKDILTLAKGGAKFLAEDLEEELALKETEMARLRDTAAAARKMAEDPDTEYPVEITYSHTVRGSSQGLATKTETLTVNDAREAQSAADAIDRNPERRSKLRDLMVVDLEHRQSRLAEMTEILPEFVKSSQSLLGEVIANLR